MHFNTGVLPNVASPYSTTTQCTYWYTGMYIYHIYSYYIFLYIYIYIYIYIWMTFNYDLFCFYTLYLQISLHITTRLFNVLNSSFSRTTRLCSFGHTVIHNCIPDDCTFYQITVLCNITRNLRMRKKKFLVSFLPFIPAFFQLFFLTVEIRRIEFRPRSKEVT
jgi:hypothetical protein